MNDLPSWLSLRADRILNYWGEPKRGLTLAESRALKLKRSRRKMANASRRRNRHQ